jgi:hypothetical protein
VDAEHEIDLFGKSEEVTFVLPICSRQAGRAA